jgi:hypothetical protein
VRQSYGYAHDRKGECSVRLYFFRVRYEAPGA